MKELVEAAMDDAMEVDGGAGEAENGGGVKGKVRGPWSSEEDAILTQMVGKFGPRNWSLIARGIPGRSGKSCRLRWCNQLDPCVKRKPFTSNIMLDDLKKCLSGVYFILFYFIARKIRVFCAFMVFYDVLRCSKCVTMGLLIFLLFFMFLLIFSGFRYGDFYVNC